MAQASKTKSATDAAKTAVEDAKTTAKSVAQDAAERVKQEATVRVGAVQDAAAGEVGNVARALRDAATRSRSGSPQERTFGQMAEVLADASEAIGQKDLGTIAQDVTHFARRNPMLFLGGAALAGLAVSRFAKASTPEPDPYDIDYAIDADRFDAPGSV